jgi:methane monooxygenase component C
MPRKLKCDVTEILDHGERVYSVFLEPEDLAPHFLPGQFLHLALDNYIPGDFWPDSRPFSIASDPADRRQLRITYAVKGQFTRRMEAELRPGRIVWVKMPYGEFVIKGDKEVCLLAGGTGVTAFTAFLAGLFAEHRDCIHLFYGARLPDLLIYRSLIETAAKRCPSLKVHFLVEEGSEGTNCLPGRIETDAVLASISNPLTLTYYLAGPPGMVHSLTSGLSQRGIPSSRIIADAWE